MREWMQLFYKKLNWQFLASYIIVFLVPFLILSGILTWLIVSETKERIETANSEGLTQISSVLEEHFKKLNDITLDMSINPNVAKSGEVSPVEAMSFERELQRYVFFSDIVEHMYVYYNHNERMFTNTGTLDIEPFFSQRYKYEQIDPQLFQNNLTSSEPKLVSFKSKERQNLFYFVPFSLNGTKIGEIIYVIPTFKLMSKVVAPFQKEYQNYVLYLDQEEILTTLPEEQNQELVVDSYFSQSKTLGGINLTIYSLISDSLLNQEVEKALLLVLGSLFILLVIGIVIVIYSGYRQYEPVYRLNRLYRYIAEHQNADIHTVHFDEVGDFLFQQSMMVDSTKKEIQSIRYDSFWKHLLKGEFSDLDSIEKELATIGSTFSIDKSYLLGIIPARFSTDAEEDLKKKSLLISFFPYMQENYQVACIEMTAWNQFIFIFQMEQTEPSERSLDRIKGAFSRFLSEELNTEMALNFAESVSSIEKIPLAYISVMVQKEEKYQKQQDQNQQATFSYPEQSVLALKQAVKVGNTNAIEKIIEEIVVKEKSLSSSVFLRQSYYHYVIQQLLTMKEESKVNMPFSYQSYSLDFNQIQLEIKRLALALSQAFAKEAEAREKKVDQEILQMIHGNFTRASFSLEEMAMKFGVSLSKMSVMIKNETNVSFSKYVQELRIEQVKKELLGTSKTVKEIIIDVGYYDIANFTRKFREVVGVPPGQYRKINEKKG